MNWFLIFRPSSFVLASSFHFFSPSLELILVYILADVMAKLTSFILLAALRAVTAAYIPRDDQECASFENLLSSSNPQFSCLAPFGKLSDLGSTNASASVTSTASVLNNWFTEFCAIPACSTDTPSQVVSITSGCSDFNGTQFAEQYPEFRELFCLKDTTNNTFCTTETLSSGNTTDTTDDTSSAPANPEDALAILAFGSYGFGCTECTKAQYQAGVKFGLTDTSGFSSQCSADFVASLNSTVVGIKQTAVTSQSGFKNGASSITPTSVLILLAVPGFWALL
ncbi:hypothetical protein C8R45DRAFT_1179828 [Mycena sanguinolenta]|nr:hypothetical protein C8R45DRAFT_1179828 [Mycena sanguinolenta]